MSGRPKARAWAAALVLAPGLILATALGLATLAGLAPLPERLPGADPGAFARAPILGDDGTVLTRSYAGRWNVDDWRSLSRIPVLIQEAFIAAEDRRFHHHHGVDWLARLRALAQNLRAGRRVSGASTISEQAVRMLHPRRRGVWARWLEGFDALRAERRYGKTAILEFYLNQVPFAARRRGVVQAARWYFDRDLETLSERESIALAVMVRAPSRLDPRSNPHALSWRVEAVRQAMGKRPGGEGAPPGEQALPWETRHTRLAVEARQFVRFVRERHAHSTSTRPLRSTLSPSLQRQVSQLLRGRIAALAARGADHAATLVAEHATGRIRAWAVVSRAGLASTEIDMVRSPRQPGSTLKPFVYALALEQGWSPAQRISDAPLSQRVGSGLHAYRNYSRRYYGEVSLREALGSSLNVPAVRTLTAVGPARVLQRLRALGVRSLDDHPERYGDGLALGNGAVTLFELTQAYAGLANRGRSVTLCVLRDRCGGPGPAVFSPEVSSLIADILADPHARRLEFGRGGVLEFPVPTAVKTGTSSDHRDAWAVGFDHRHVVAIWMGNLDQRPMHGVSGASGPALALRSVFAAIRSGEESRPLYLSPQLRRDRICGDGSLSAADRCEGTHQEWSIPGITRLSARPDGGASTPRARAVQIKTPSHALRVAVDPRLPRDAQRFLFTLRAPSDIVQVSWHLDGHPIGVSEDPRWLWTIVPGEHRLRAVVRLVGGQVLETGVVPFSVLGAG